MSSLKVKTNNVPREITYGYQLTAKEKEEFDYIAADELDGHLFVRYRGLVYDIGDFMRLNGGPLTDLGWQGAAGGSYFSGVVIKFVRIDHDDLVILGTYCE